MSEYKLGGFRFDLMGLHDLETMKQVASETKKINSHATVFGEPWTGGDSPLKESDSAKQINGNRYDGYGAFNDQMRDAMIKGGMNAATDLGWIDNTEDSISNLDGRKLIDGIKGITNASVVISDPDKSVTYATCHDNYTLRDRFVATKKVEIDDEETLVKMNVLTNSLVFTSQGTSFMLAGEEFLRTKEMHADEAAKVGADTYIKVGDHYLSHNSYNSTYRVNELDYSLKAKHLDMFESYKKLIALKQNVDGLHLDKNGINNLNVVAANDYSYIQYSLNDTKNNKQYMIIHSNGLGTESEFDLTGYTLYWSTISKGEKTLSSATKIQPFETLIAYK